MSSLLSKLNSTSKKKPVDPREIFMSLPKKEKRYEYPRDVQSEVWKKWFDKRAQKNTIIKMNTGSGKTVVGLMVLQSCLNEKKGPAIYIVPDKYLVLQVCDEAEKLGIKVVTDENDYDYSNSKAIFVAPIQKLVNGRSIFGMQASNTYPIGSVLLDDVHACLNTITSQFSMKILMSESHELYNEMIELFADSWKAYNIHSYIDIVEMQDPTKDALIPFWLWQDKLDDVYRLIMKYNNNDNLCVFFHFPLIMDCLSSCSCIITTRAIEITPKGIPISKISSFDSATRRIFMSATLADDSVFVSALGLKQDGMPDIIAPDRANDIGDRLILFPKHLNSTLLDEDIRIKISSFAKRHNVVVIVPSPKQGLLWDPTGKRLVTKDNIEKAVAVLKKQHVGLVVFVNRYDGIDLPDDACRLLVLDGLPPFHSQYNQYVQSINPTSNLILREQIQKIEQGMGRGVRSNSDFCCVVLMGNKLADVLLRNNGVSYFSDATTAQYELSKELWGLLKNENSAPSVDEIFELADYSFNRELEWIEQSKECLSGIDYKTTPNICKVTAALRKAFDYANVREWEKAVEALDIVINQELEDKTKGYLMQIKAEYTNFFDKSKAQQILRSARSANAGVLKCIEGIQYDKQINDQGQAKGVLEYSAKISTDPNQYLLYIGGIFDDMFFSPDAKGFEISVERVGEILGFKSSRPELEMNDGPDNLWAIGNCQYFVIECKSGTTTNTISKDYCDQLGGSVRWFDQEYGNGYKCTPIMVHCATLLDTAARLVPDMRIITPELLDKLKKQIHQFTIAFVRNENWQDEIKVTALLKSYKLRAQDIITEYTIKTRDA